MDSATLADASLVKDRATTGTTYDVLLRATVTTRFRLKDRWLIAGSFASEAAARQEFGSLGREFPAETVSLMLVRCEAEDASGNFRERVLDKREPASAGGTPQRRVLRATPSPREQARSRSTPGPRPPAAPPAPLPSNAMLQWQLVGGLVVATLLLTLMLG